MILVLNGSPKNSGNTMSVAKRILSKGEHLLEIINCYELDIMPCKDCGGCNKRITCIYADQMEQLIFKILNASAIIIVTPLYFATTTPPLLSLLSRLQPLFIAKYFRKETIHSKVLKCGLISTAGGDWPNQFVGLKKTFIDFCALLGVTNRKEVLIDGTDNISPLNNNQYVNDIQEFTKWINL